MRLPETPSFRLDGRKALVTGASKGLGLAMAMALADAGAAVTIVARNRIQVEEAAFAIRSRGGQAHPLAIDILDFDAVAQAVAESGPYQVLVNNAAINRLRTLAEIESADFDMVSDLNVKAMVMTTRAVVKGLAAAGLGGSIINISSQMGHVGGPKRILYCTTKHAVEGMSKAMAWELGPADIRVNTICPTFIETDMTKHMLADQEFRTYVTSRIALGRVAHVEDIMGAVVYLASDASAMVTGSALMVDGGWTAA